MPFRISKEQSGYSERFYDFVEVEESMKKWKIAIGLMVCILTGTICYDTGVYATGREFFDGVEEENTVEEEKSVSGNEAPVLHAGLQESKIIEVEYSDNLDIFKMRDEEILGSSVYASWWDKCSTNYYYNMLSEDEKVFWDALDAMCLGYLCSEEMIPAGYFGCCTEYVEAFGLDTERALEVAQIFRYSNPQYYFLMPGFSWSGSRNPYVGIHVYEAFANGASRQAATQAVKRQVESWASIASGYGTEAEKVLAIHDLILNKVDYNYAIYESGFDEETEYSQTAYSVFCMDKTVCAGYAQAFEMMCNVVGVDCIVVTSYNHGWNKVRINDSWYNVDCTFADQGSYIYYSYYARNDAYYASSSSHQPMELWSGYLPPCTLDSGSNYDAPGTPQNISQTVAAPIISKSQSGADYLVTLSCNTPNAIIYYTTGGETPSPAYTKSTKYTSPFMISSSCTVKAIAVCDSYRDSSISSDNINPLPTYYISFWGNGAASGGVSALPFVKGQEITLPGNAFVRNGYEFTGWNTKADGTGTTYSPGQKVSTASWNGNITLYAQWKAGTDSNNKACFVALLYENVLERNAENSEIQYWISELENGRSGAEVAYLFIFSQEFLNRNFGDSDYVERLYMSLMGRASDALGKEDWLTRLSNGVSREYVMTQFIGSAEFTNKCNSYGIVRGERALIEARDQNYNVTRFVARNYTQFLSRPYEVDGLNYWCGFILNREKTMQEIASGFVFSAECQNKGLSNTAYVEMLYKGCFDRVGDANGVAYWVDYLNTGAMNREQVFNGFANSQEFANMVSSYGL